MLPGKKKGLAKDYRELIRAGPGEWHCACCNPYNCCVNRMKPLAHRKVRRIARQRLREIEHE